MELINKILRAFLGDFTLKAKRQQVALLLAKNLLYERTGFDALHPDLQKKLNLVLEEMKVLGRPMRVADGFRSWKRQDELYGGAVRVTNAKGGQSYHQYGLSADVIFKKYNWSPPRQDWWDTFGRVAKEHGLEWGGDWNTPDRPHVELPYATWEELRPYFLED